MDNGDSVERVNGARCGEGASGAPPASRRGVLRGREVREMASAGASPSGAAPQTTQECSWQRGRLRSRAAREIGSAGHGSRPYSVPERTGPPGAARVSEAGPSAAPVRGPGLPEPEPPAGFNWLSTYRNITARWETDTQWGNVYAAAAGAGALRDIDQAVRDAYAEHCKGRSASHEPSTPAMELNVRIVRSRARHRENTARLEAVIRSLGEIHRLTHAKDTELRLRSDELSAASHPYPAAVPDPYAIEQWLRVQAGAAHESEIERSYFRQLAQEVALGLDPWTVSRRLIECLPEPGNSVQAAPLQAAHGRLVQAMAGRVMPQAAPSDPGGMELPSGFRWLASFRKIHERLERDKLRQDVYAVAASAGALRDIDLAVRDSDIRFRKQRFDRLSPSTVDRLYRLQRIRDQAKTRNQQDRLETMARSLDAVNSLTHAKEVELRRRGDELRAASRSRPAAVPDRQALGQWLWGQAGAAHESEIERLYFRQLAQDVAREIDPWTVSRRLIECLPEPGDSAQAARLQAAHRRLLQAMTGNPPRPQAPLRVGSPAAVAPLARESQAPASRRQQIVERLQSSKRLTEAQVASFRSAVAEADESGTLGATTARPQAWAMSMLERIQESVDWPIAELTESETRSIESDWKRLGELLESLERHGHL